MKNLLLLLIISSTNLLTIAASTKIRHFESPKSVKMFEVKIQTYAVDELELAKQHLIEQQKQHPDSLDLYFLLGKIDMRREKWGDAKDWLDDITDKYDPENIRAHYNLGICDREDGIARDPLSRRIFWGNSEKHFNEVIRLDSTYRQVFLELAWLRRYQQKYAEAIDMGLRQLKIRPETRTQQDLFIFYDAFIANGGKDIINPFWDSEKFVYEWLSSRKGIYDQYFLGEFWRRFGVYHKADSIFTRLLKRRNLNFPRTPIYLSLVRLYTETNNHEEAEKRYWQALDELPTLEEFRFLFEDMHFIFSDREYNKIFFNQKEMQQFTRQFWQQHDPLPASGYNIRLAEHYKRLIYAEKNFRYDGFRLFFNNPDKLNILKFPIVFYHNHTLNDKGLVYIRFGEPDDKAFSAGEDFVLNESWLYHSRGNAPKLIFHFEIAEHGGAPGCWRLVPTLTNIEAFESRLGWDNLIGQIYRASDPMTRQEYLTQMRYQVRDNIEWAMEREYHQWSDKLEPIEFHISATRFYVAPNKYRASISIAAPRNSIFSKNIDSTSIKLEAGAAIFNETWQKIDHQNEILTISNDEKLYYKDQLIKKYDFLIEVPKIHCASHIKQIETERLNGYKLDLDFQEFNTPDLICSDLEVAYEIEEGVPLNSNSQQNFNIIPNPTFQFKPQEPVFIYYEIYNLKKDEDGTAHFRVEYTAKSIDHNKNILKKMWSLVNRAEKQTIKIQNTRENKGSTAKEYISFDFSNFESTDVELNIQITDILTDATCDGKTEFALKN